MDELEDKEELVLIHEVDTIEFDHIRFGYGEEDLMSDISFQVHRGERVAIVGPTGAGKTTLTNLLLRFYDVKRGIDQDQRNRYSTIFLSSAP